MNRPSSLRGEVLWKRWQTTDKWPLAKVTKWSWPGEFLKGSIWMHFHMKEHNSIRKSTFAPFSIQKSKGPCHKIGQDQPGVTIYVNFKELTPQMLCTKFQGNRPSGSGREFFLRFLPFMGMVVILVMWPGPNIYVFPPLPGGSIWN